MERDSKGVDGTLGRKLVFPFDDIVTGACFLYWLKTACLYACDGLFVPVIVGSKCGFNVCWSSPSPSGVKPHENARTTPRRPMGSNR